MANVLTVLSLTNDFLPILRAFLKSLRINLISNIPRTKTTKAIAKDAIYGNFGSSVVPVPNQKSYSWLPISLKNLPTSDQNSFQPFRYHYFTIIVLLFKVKATNFKSL